MKSEGAMAALFKAAGGKDATDEEIRRVAESNPALWRAALEELAADGMRKALSNPRVDLIGAGGFRGGALTDVPLRRGKGDA